MLMAQLAGQLGQQRTLSNLSLVAKVLSMTTNCSTQSPTKRNGNPSQWQEANPSA